MDVEKVIGLIDLQDEEYKKNYERIFGKKNMLIKNKMIADEFTEKH